MKENTDFEVITSKILEIKGDSKVREVVLENGESLQVDGIFVALGEASGLNFARKIGVVTENDNIVVDENMATNIDGLYSCGNSTGGLLQIAKAVCEGAKAGLAVVNYINTNK